MKLCAKQMTSMMNTCIQILRCMTELHGALQSYCASIQQPASLVQYSSSEYSPSYTTLQHPPFQNYTFPQQHSPYAKSSNASDPLNLPQYQTEASLDTLRNKQLHMMKHTVNQAVQTQLKTSDVFILFRSM